jgi:hypothetical protein
LQEELRDLPIVEVIEVEKAVYMHPPRGLDMIFMTLPAAERWRPDFRSREAQILKTSLEDQKKGFPPLIVTGINLTDAASIDSVSQVRIVLETVIAAVIGYDKDCKAIDCLGFWVMDLTRGVTMKQLSVLLHRILHVED